MREDPSGDLSGWVPPPRPAARALEGRYVRLEPLAAGHGVALDAANRVDDAIWTWLPYGPFADEAAYSAWLERVAGREDPMFFALLDRASGLPGGVASLMRISPEAGSIEVGHICLSRAMQRTRAASEMVFLFAREVFGLGYRRFEWKCDAANAASRRAAQRFGFSFEGVFRQHMVVKRQNRDTAWFSMLDGEWPERKRRFEAWLDPANFNDDGSQKLPLEKI